MKKIISILLTAMIVFSLVGCTKKETAKEEEPKANCEEALIKAKGSTVNFYGWGGSEFTNNWIDNVLAKKVKEDYDITLKRVPMDIDNILNKMLGEKQANNESGTIDLVWINGENFYTAKKADLLYGPFADILPNFNKYIDEKSPDVTHDFGYEVEGYEVPYGKAQLVMAYNNEFVKTPPKSAEELMEFCKANPGKFTYPAPPDFTGSAFVRNIIYDIVGKEKLDGLETKEEVQKAIQPAIDYLNELKPYLWSEGKTYPATIAQLDNMFADKEVVGTVTYSPNSIDGKIKTGEYPKEAKSAIFEKGTIGNTHFVAIPFNASNKEGAMAVANAILSVEMQSTKYDPITWGDLPVLDNSKLSDEEKSIFDKAKISDAIVPQDELLSHRKSEPAAHLIPIIEKIWLETVAKGD